MTPARIQPSQPGEIMNADDTLVLAMCKAHDREEASHRGEPSPWDDEGEDPEAFATFKADRLTAMSLALDVARQSLPLHEGDGVPEGLVLAPVEPTQDMLDAAAQAPDDDDWVGAMVKAYSAMLAARPEPRKEAGSATLVQDKPFECKDAGKIWTSREGECSCTGRASSPASTGEVEGQTHPAAWPNGSLPPGTQVGAEISGKMWSAGKRAFEAHAERYRSATTTESAAAISDVAPAEIWAAMSAASTGPENSRPDKVAPGDPTAGEATCSSESPPTPAVPHDGGEVERVSRAIFPGWWEWADKHFDATISGDVVARQAKIAAAERAILALRTHPTLPVADDDAVERLRIVLQGAWAKAEPRHPVTLNPTSYVATFTELAKAALSSSKPLATEAIRERCAQSNFHEHDGCSCSDDELRRRALATTEEARLHPPAPSSDPARPSTDREWA